MFYQERLNEKVNETGSIKTMTKKRIGQILKTLPEYMRAHIGKIRIHWFNFRVFIRQGYTSTIDCSIHLSSFANEDIVLHEAFHSFMLKMLYEYGEEWLTFASDFDSEDEYNLSDKYNLRDFYEDTADIFILLVSNGENLDPLIIEKYKAVERLITGGYAI